MIIEIDDPLTTRVEEGLHAVIAGHGGGVTGMNLGGIAAINERIQLGMYRLARI